MKYKLKKESDIYDDWVYMGKETYGSKVVTSSSLKPGSKFFDVLGRVYDKMKAKIQYYVRPDAIKRDSRDVPMEFEVWARIIKDERGNDIQMFIKDDEKNKFRKDSSFYHDGYWEVFEFNDAIGETVFKTASGARSVSIYDDKERLKEYYRIDVNGDTLESQKYEWRNGRLVRMTANGVVRNYVYGKTLQDTVKVTPSDKWIKDYYNSGYDGTVGIMPEEGTREYKIFAKGPYRYVFSEKSSNDYIAVKKSVGSLNVLQKRIDDSGSCVDKDFDMPIPQCIRDVYDSIRNPNSASTQMQGRYGWPGKGEILAYGSSTVKFQFNYDCICNASGKYQFDFTSHIRRETIEIKQSTWKYYRDGNYWDEFCWYRPDLNTTYRHEALHIRNSRRAINKIIKFASTYNTYNAEKECYEQAEKELDWIEARWEEWNKNEYEHINPESPTISKGNRDGYICE